MRANEVQLYKLNLDSVAVFFFPFFKIKRKKEKKENNHYSMPPSLDQRDRSSTHPYTTTSSIIKLKVNCIISN